MHKKSTKRAKKPAAGKGMGKGGPKRIERGFRPPSKQSKADRVNRLEGKSL